MFFFILEACYNFTGNFSPDLSWGDPKKCRKPLKANNPIPPQSVFLERQELIGWFERGKWRHLLAIWVTDFKQVLVCPDNFNFVPQFLSSLQLGMIPSQPS